MLIPVLIPTFMMLVFVRLSLSARSSRKRIKLLESDEESRSKTLVSMFARLERGIEDAVVDIVDEVPSGSRCGSCPSTPGSSTPFEGGVSPPPTAIPSAFKRAQVEVQRRNSSEQDGALSDSSSTKSRKSNKTKTSIRSSSSSSSTNSNSDSNSKSQPIFTPEQLEMVASLNALPNLRKRYAYFEHVRNSHAMIVCRDVKRFEIHKKGESVLRHWADGFVL